MGFEMQSVALAQEQSRIIGLAKPRDRLGECIEYRLQIERRATDDLENIGGGGLLLQRLAQIARRWRSSLSSRAFSIAITA